LNSGLTSQRRGYCRAVPSLHRERLIEHDRHPDTGLPEPLPHGHQVVRAALFPRLPSERLYLKVLSHFVAMVNNQGVERPGGLISALTRQLNRGLQQG
jgi:hypothetical protein